VHWQNYFGCLNFNDQTVIHKHVQPKTGVDLQFFEFDWQQHLSLH